MRFSPVLYSYINKETKKKIAKTFPPFTICLGISAKQLIYAGRLKVIYLLTSKMEKIWETENKRNQTNLKNVQDRPS